MIKQHSSAHAVSGVIGQQRCRPPLGCTSHSPASAPAGPPRSAVEPKRSKPSANKPGHFRDTALARPLHAAHTQRLASCLYRHLSSLRGVFGPRCGCFALPAQRQLCRVGSCLVSAVALQALAKSSWHHGGQRIVPSRYPSTHHSRAGPCSGRTRLSGGRCRPGRSRSCRGRSSRRNWSCGIS